MIPNAEILISTELIRMILDLPPSYKVVAARTTDADFGHTVRLVVEANELPAVLPGDQPHLVTPRFRHVNTGQAELAAIDVQHSRDRG
jgi:phosphate starvation-inducible protein PhoH